MHSQISIRNLVLAVLALTASASAALAQGGLGAPTLPQPAAPIKTEISPVPYVPQDSSLSGLGLFDFGRSNSGFLSGNHDFDRFIGFMSNPIQSIDPRAVTEIWPVYSGGWANGNGPLLAEANAQAYGAGIYVALSDRLSFGLNQGGYSVLNVNGTRQGLLAKLGLPVPERDIGGQREGWLNLGGFVQYTLIANAEKQFLLTAGVRWEAPSGAEQLFQGGANPAYLSPYLTAGKEFGCWHVLATTGYEFPAGEGQATTSTCYFNLHIDRKIGWLYPLVEFNGSYHTSSVNLNLPTGHGVLDLGSFDSSGNLLTVAVGANAVLIPGKLEFGAVYERPIASQDHFEFNAVLVKMTFRY